MASCGRARLLEEEEEDDDDDDEEEGCRRPMPRAISSDPTTHFPRKGRRVVTFPRRLLPSAGVIFILSFFCCCALLLIVPSSRHDEASSPRRTFSSASSTSAGGFLRYDAVRGRPSYDVAYDGRSFVVAGQRTVFLSGSMHPPRMPPHTWARELRRAAANGLNMVQVYVFWNVHEPSREGDVDWTSVDLVGFLRLAADAGLFVTLRVGPYVCAEWRFGGLPLWLMNTTAYEDVRLRTVDRRWMALMKRWFERVVDEVAPLLAPLGGPVVMVQVENELPADAPRAYVEWSGAMAEAALASAVAARTGKRRPGPKPPPRPVVVMCEGAVASNAVPACNGPTCAEYLERKNAPGHAPTRGGVLVDYPGVWTENEGGYQIWGGSPHDPTAYFWGRSAGDAAYDTLRWFARGGSHMNWYMYSGGNNFGGTEGDAVTTAYAADVNVCPDGLPNEPKFTHLGNMHAALADAARVMLAAPPQVNRSRVLPCRTVLWHDAARKVQSGKRSSGAEDISCTVVAYVYAHGGDSVAFLENNGAEDVLAAFEGAEFYLSARSAAMVRRSEAAAPFEVAFNTTAVPVVTKLRRVTPAAAVRGAGAGELEGWESWGEPASEPAVAAPRCMSARTPQPQMSLTGDRTEYLWYHASFMLPPTRSPSALRLSIVGRLANAYTVYLDGRLMGFASDQTHSPHNQTVVVPHVIDLGVLSPDHPPAAPVVHALAVLSESLGVSNYPIAPGSRPADFEKGVMEASLVITEVVRDKGEGVKQTSKAIELLDVARAAGGSPGDKWVMCPGLYGESLGASRSGPPGAGGRAAVPWEPVQRTATTTPVPGVTWLRARFTPPPSFGAASDPGADPEALLLNVTGLGRGHAYVNGRALGRYWTKRRNDGSGMPTQSLYVVPSEWLAAGGAVNALVLVEVGGGDVDLFQGVSLSVARMERVSPREAAEAAAAVSNSTQSCTF